MIHLISSARKISIMSQMIPDSTWTHVTDMVIKPNLSIPESSKYRVVSRNMCDIMGEGI